MVEANVVEVSVAEGIVEEEVGVEEGEVEAGVEVVVEDEEDLENLPKHFGACDATSTSPC